ncbi:hypothetical protein [Rhodococcus chondri]|uniref:Transposase n=1 Tax=Rhodococcus chondri TaxID=3065941 RepID=A0ABU7JML2_9NOCA|nr:hypothetical protein [Rhodococcus sp. CC-R104]MEE2031266.1 hypothetical protein [Rhodococcus sp. CC-R104]
MRTIELGVTITDVALDNEITVVFHDLLVDGPDRCPRCGNLGRYRDTIVRSVTDLPVAGHPLQLRVRIPAIDGRTSEAHSICHGVSEYRLPQACLMDPAHGSRSRAGA